MTVFTTKKSSNFSWRSNGTVYLFKEGSKNPIAVCEYWDGPKNVLVYDWAAYKESGYWKWVKAVSAT